MSTSIRIRPFKDTDVSAILTWCPDEETFYKWSFGILGEFPLTEEKFAITGQHMRFTAIDGEEPVGFFIARNPGGNLSELRFGYVIVDPKRRGQGIGKEMLRQALRYAFDIYRADRVSLGVYQDNPPAVNCYRGIGFTESGKTEKYEVCGSTRTAIEMEIFREDA